MLNFTSHDIGTFARNDDDDESCGWEHGSNKKEQKSW